MGANLVVGGGIAGILSAILAKKFEPDAEVVLIEREAQCGGLLGSVTNDAGIAFDFGTHIPGHLGIEELDEILFGGIDTGRFRVMDKLTPGNITTNLEFYKYTQMPHLANLDKATLALGTYQLLEAEREKAKDATNAYEAIVHQFGETFTEIFFRPVLRKLQGAELEDLDPRAALLFGFRRLLVGPPHMMRLLKQIPELDDVLTFATYNEGVSSISHFYPKDGSGIGAWFEFVADKARDLGVDIRTATSIEALEVEDGAVATARCSDGRSIAVRNLYWTTAPFHLLKLAGVDYTPQYKPDFRPMMLHHMVYDRPFLTHNTHVYTNAPELSTFRATVYPNLIGDAQEPPFKLTMETLCDDISDPVAMQERTDRELRSCGLVDPEAVLLSCMNVPVPAGFPVVTTAFPEELGRQHRAVTEQLTNVVLLGKASEKSFFMKEVMVEVHAHFSGKVPA